MVGAIGVLLVLGFFAWRGLPDGRLHLTFLDVGQGDAIFIETPSGRQVLVDGGPGESALLSQLGRQMPFWDRTIDVVVLTHSDADHLTGLVSVLERYEVGIVVFREEPAETDLYARWLELVEVEGADVYQGETGLRVSLDEGLDMTMLHPGPELVGGREGSSNNNSIVAKLQHGLVSVLLTGDIEAEVEQQLVGDGAELGSTVLKAAHHGGCSSTTGEFLEAVDPEVVVISVGAENDFGHPCAQLMERLGDTPVYRTDEQGAIELVTDGDRLWVETER